MRGLMPAKRSEFQLALAQDCLRMLQGHVEIPRVNDQRLLDHVVGADGSEEGFLSGGFLTAVGLMSVLQLAGRPISCFRRILDFGCGSGRVTHWLRHLAGDAELTGADINPEAIAWCRENLDFEANFICNGPRPPLPLAAESADLIYGISVLTHLDEDLQFQWLRELHRVAAPGAVVVLTVHTDYRAVRTLSQSAFAKYRRRGFFYQRAASDDKTVAGLPDFYQVAFHTRNYIAGKWTRLFEPLLSVAPGPFWSQQAIVLGKRDRTTPRLLKPRWKHVKLPLGGMDTPGFGGPPQGDIQHVAGWAFDPDSDERRNVTAWVNGKPAEMRYIEVERDDVKAAFPDIPHAGNAGFMLNVELPGNDHGFHVIWFTAGDSPVPVSATYVTG
ncbi:MAG: class I SAM-dependent methyltransferase [Gammaproteobacteria bacterium]|nr:class I SAM-dependent methyltransferase [Gammaproteobacteria bacterium]MYE28676.1 class I SAM-dependent methyltransferase [Gammaproteobacteria bacterium]